MTNEDQVKSDSLVNKYRNNKNLGNEDSDMKCMKQSSCVNSCVVEVCVCVCQRGSPVGCVQ